MDYNEYFILQLRRTYVRIDAHALGDDGLSYRKTNRQGSRAKT